METCNKIGRLLSGKTFVRFVLVGVLNTLFGVGLYCLFIYMGVPYRAAVLLSTVLGVLFNFKTIGALVFKNKDNRLIFRFVSVYVITYFINIGLIRVFLCVGINEYYAGILSTPVVALCSYGLQKRLVYRRK